MSAPGANEQPKKYQTACWMWVLEHRVALAKECGSAKSSEVAKFGGKMWRGLPAAAKAPYEEKSAAAKKLYEGQMAAYKEAGGVCKRKRGATTVEEKWNALTDAQKNAPKKPGSPYWQFLNANRRGIAAELALGEKKALSVAVSKMAGEKWNALTDAQRRHYKEQHKQLMEEYKTARDAAKSEGATEEGGGGVDGAPALAMDTLGPWHLNPSKVAKETVGVEGKRRGGEEAGTGDAKPRKVGRKASEAPSAGTEGGTKGEVAPPRAKAKGERQRTLKGKEQPATVDAQEPARPVEPTANPECAQEPTQTVGLTAYPE